MTIQPINIQIVAIRLAGLMIGCLCQLPFLYAQTNAKLYLEESQISPGEEVEFYTGERIPIEFSGAKPGTKAVLKFTQTLVPFKKYNFSVNNEGKISDTFDIPKTEIDKLTAKLEYIGTDDKTHIFEFKALIVRQDKED